MAGVAACTNLLQNTEQWQWVSATGEPMILGYARVSKGEAQDTRMQETALRAAGVERLFTEQASGGRWDRPHLHRLLDQLRPGDVQGDRILSCSGEHRQQVVFIETT